jgi:hypothetical protein
MNYNSTSQNSHLQLAIGASFAEIPVGMTTNILHLRDCESIIDLIVLNQAPYRKPAESVGSTFPKKTNPCEKTPL